MPSAPRPVSTVSAAFGNRARRACAAGSAITASPNWPRWMSRMRRGLDIPRLFPHHLDDHPLAPLTVKLRIVDLLPGTEVEFPLGDGHDHLVVHQQALEMGVAVGFAGAVVLVVGAERRQMLQPRVNIPQQSVFGVVDPH